MDGTIIKFVTDKLEWLLAHPEVTWSGIGIYALSLAGSAVLVVASCMFRRKKKASAGSKFKNRSGEQNIAQGDKAIGKQENNYGIPPEYLTQYAEEFGVTKAALASFFRILEEQQVSPGDLDSKLREIATLHIELKQQIESFPSNDPQLQSLKERAGQALDDGDYDQVEKVLDWSKERYREILAAARVSLTRPQPAQEQWQLSIAGSFACQAQLQRLQYRYEKAALYWQEAAAALPEGYEEQRAEYLGMAGNDLNRIACYAEALSLYEQSLSIRREIGDRKGEAISLNNIGLIYQHQGDYSKALNYLEQSLTICREVGDKEGKGTTLNNIAMIYKAKGDYPKALKHLKQNLLLAREIHDKEGESVTLNNIGTIHDAQGASTAALECYNQALAIAREIKDKALESTSLSNIGMIHDAQENYDAALEQYEQSLVIKQQIGDRRGEGTTLNNIGKVYEAKGDYAAALKQYELALARAKEIGEKAGEATYSWNIGWLYEGQGELAKAEPYLSRAVELEEQLEYPDLEKDRQVLADIRTKLHERPGLFARAKRLLFGWQH